MVFPAPCSVRDGIQLMSLSALRPGNGMLLPGRQRAGCPCGRGGGCPGLLSQGHRPFPLRRSQTGIGGGWNPGDLKGYLVNGAWVTFAADLHKAVIKSRTVTYTSVLYKNKENPWGKSCGMTF